MKGQHQRFQSQLWESINPEPSCFRTEVRRGPGDHRRLPARGCKVKRHLERSCLALPGGLIWSGPRRRSPIWGTHAVPELGRARGTTGLWDRCSACGGPSVLPSAPPGSALLQDLPVGLLSCPPASTFLSTWRFQWKQAPETQRVGVPGPESRGDTTDRHPTFGVSTRLLKLAIQVQCSPLPRD